MASTRDRNAISSGCSGELRNGIDEASVSRLKVGYGENRVRQLPFPVGAVPPSQKNRLRIRDSRTTVKPANARPDRGLARCSAALPSDHHRALAPFDRKPIVNLDLSGK